LAAITSSSVVVSSSREPSSVGDDDDAAVVVAAVVVFAAVEIFNFSATSSANLSAVPVVVVCSSVFAFVAFVVGVVVDAVVAGALPLCAAEVLIRDAFFVFFFFFFLCVWTLSFFFFPSPLAS
jgi:hypothetical protein